MAKVLYLFNSSGEWIAFKIGKYLYNKMTRFDKKCEIAKKSKKHIDNYHILLYNNKA